MKIVSGEILSSHPISLSKAAKILAKFSQVDNGATPSFVAYLRRASASFNELVQIHKELKGSDGRSRRHVHSSSGVTSAGGRVNYSERDYASGRSEDMGGESDVTKNKTKTDGGSVGSCYNEERDSHIGSDGGDDMRLKQKRESKTNVANVNRGRDYVNHDGLNLARSENDVEGKDGRNEMEKQKKKNKKKQHSGYEVEEIRGDNSGARTMGKVQDNGSCHDIQAGLESSKQKQRSRNKEEKDHELGEEGSHRIGGTDGDVRTGGNEGKKYKKKDGSSLEMGNNDSIGVDAGEKKESRKRKSEEVAADGVLDGSEERFKSRKKKKRKSGV